MHFIKRTKRAMKVVAVLLTVAILLPFIFVFGGKGKAEDPQSGSISLVRTASETSGETDTAISAAENAMTLTAVTGSSTLIEWAAVWEQTGTGTLLSGGKTLLVSQYLSVTPNAENTNEAKVQCLQGFPKRIAVTATRADNGNSASVVFEYLKKGTLSDLKLRTSENGAPTDTVKLGGNFTYSGLPYYSLETVGTITPVNPLSYSLKLSDEIKSTSEMQGDFRHFTAFPSYGFVSGFTGEADFYKKLIKVATPTAQQYEAEIYAALIAAIRNNPTIPHAVLTCTYQGIYEGKTYWTRTATIEIKFNVSLIV